MYSEFKAHVVFLPEGNNKGRKKNTNIAFVGYRTYTHTRANATEYRYKHSDRCTELKEIKLRKITNFQPAMTFPATETITNYPYNTTM